MNDQGYSESKIVSRKGEAVWKVILPVSIFACRLSTAMAEKPLQAVTREAATAAAARNSWFGKLQDVYATAVELRTLAEARLVEGRVAIVSGGRMFDALGVLDALIDEVEPPSGGPG